MRCVVVGVVVGGPAVAAGVLPISASASTPTTTTTTATPALARRLWTICCLTPPTCPCALPFPCGAIHPGGAIHATTAVAPACSPASATTHRPGGVRRPLRRVCARPTRLVNPPFQNSWPLARLRCHSISLRPRHLCAYALRVRPRLVGTKRLSWLVGMKRRSRNVSAQVHFPCASSDAKSVRHTRSHVPSASHCARRRQHVTGLPYSL